MVTDDAALDVSGLMERTIADPLLLSQRILQQVIDRLAREHAVGDLGEELPEDAIATALGNRLAEMLLDGDRSDPSEHSTGAGESAASAAYDELLDRDAALAAALGACDCWGEHADCPICGGLGVPGWELPDRRLFAIYVRPALRTLAKRDGAVVGPPRRTKQQRKERPNV